MVLPELPDGAPWGRDDVVGGRTSLANAPWGRDDVVEDVFLTGDAAVLVVF